jgi:hypothetical protein
MARYHFSYSLASPYVPPGVVEANMVAVFKGQQLVTKGGGFLLPPGTYSPTDFEKTLQFTNVPGEFDYLVGWRGVYEGGGIKAAAYSKTKKVSETPRKEAGVKISSRTMVYLRPQSKGGQDHVVILDRVETDGPDLEPHAVFNVVFEPKIGRDWASEETGSVVHAGQWSFDQAPCVTVTMDHEFKNGKGEPLLRAHGRAFLQTLYPVAIRTLKVGGKDHFLDDLSGNGTNDDVPCRPFKKLSPTAQIEEGGYWRFHVVPKEKSATHAILNVIEPTDSRQEKPSGPMLLIESGGILGAQVGENIVLLSRSMAALISGSVQVPEAGRFRIIVGDLEPEARYRLSTGGRTLELQSSRAGTIFAKNVDLKAGDSIAVGQ